MCFVSTSRSESDESGHVCVREESGKPYLHVCYPIIQAHHLDGMHVSTPFISMFQHDLTVRAIVAVAAVLRLCNSA